MESQTSTNKPECQTCGHKVSTSGVKLSSIEFRRKINKIKNMEELTSSKDYIAQFVKSRFRLKEYVNEFLRQLEEIDDSDINNIKTWILEYEDDSGSKGMLLGNDPESPLYEFLYHNYPELNDTFHDFYNNYASSTANPLNKNHVSRALNALGIKPVMKKIKVEGKIKCVMMITATQEELSKILGKNGYYRS